MSLSVRATIAAVLLALPAAVWAATVSPVSHLELLTGPAVGAVVHLPGEIMDDFGWQNSQQPPPPPHS
jgi:hypothetical protein